MGLIVEIEKARGLIELSLRGVERIRSHVSYLNANWAALGCLAGYALIRQSQFLGLLWRSNRGNLSGVDPYPVPEVLK
jgi:hypothetical protein